MAFLKFNHRMNDVDSIIAIFNIALKTIITFHRENPGIVVVKLR